MFFTPAFGQLIANLETQSEQHKKQQQLHEPERRVMQHPPQSLDAVDRSEGLAQPEPTR